ncbi:hypothetical protein KIN20_003532 [Parelaphostrongylus tenuis]|uniref:Uncharacterized protein n=1 Tax=Parelaphostrongylus tenuis TaxID=148309 RepID=A0AAD5MIE8_PARTN|nr:hypothetical protein KIN20_003532 [Parelaphostrongylus tenuis]
MPLDFMQMQLHKGKCRAVQNRNGVMYVRILLHVVCNIVLLNAHNVLPQQERITSNEFKEVVYVSYLGNDSRSTTTSGVLKKVHAKAAADHGRPSNTSGCVHLYAIILPVRHFLSSLMPFNLPLD